MRRYWAIAASITGVSLVLFIVAEALDVPLLTDPSPWLDRGGLGAVLTGLSLLLLDVALPVPSSLVMIAHGAVFGVAAGTMLSLAGSTGAAMLGFAIGRRGGPLMVRLVAEEERQRADRLLQRWGMLAIIVTRPVPLLAEATAIMAGTSSLGWPRVLAGAVAGSLPAALLYALTGAVAASFGSGVLVFGLVLAIAGVFWLAGSWLERSSAGRPGNSLPSAD